MERCSTATYATLCRQLGVTHSMGKVGSCRQCLGRVVQRLPETRDPARRRTLGQRPPSPTRGAPVDHPLQHLAQALLLPLPQPQRLREHHNDPYATTCRVTINRVSRIKGQGPTPRLALQTPGLAGRPKIMSVVSARKICCSGDGTLHRDFADIPVLQALRLVIDPAGWARQSRASRALSRVPSTSPAWLWSPP